jgi:hypothetical protein
MYRNIAVLLRDRIIYTTSGSTNVLNDQKVQNIASKSKTVDQLQLDSTWQCSVMPPCLFSRLLPCNNQTNAIGFISMSPSRYCLCIREIKELCLH